MRFLSAVLSNVLIILGFVVGIILVAPKVAGFVPLTILTGSMVPTYNPGDVIYVKQVESPNDIKINDVVTFQETSDVRSYITHRVTGITFDQDGEVETVQTQGDANNTPDEPLKPGQVMGIVQYSLPKVGYASNYITQGGLKEYGVVAGIAAAYFFLVWVLSKYGNSGESDDEDEEEY